MQFSKYYLEFVNTDKLPIFVAKEAQNDDDYQHLTLDHIVLSYF